MPHMIRIFILIYQYVFFRHSICRKQESFVPSCSEPCVVYEAVSFSSDYYYGGNNIAFECSFFRYMDKYARLMQIMQPIAADVFKVCCVVLVNLVF